MISQTVVLLIAKGDDFSPNRAEREHGARFSAKHERDALGSRGEFAGKPIPYGWGTLDLAPADGGLDLLSSELEVLRARDVVMALRRCGATEVVLHVNLGFVDQCNFELDPAVLAALAQLGCTVAFSCYPAGSAQDGR